MESLVPPLPEVFYRQGGQDGCCLALFFRSPPPQRAGSKNQKSNHSWGKVSKNSRVLEFCRAPKHRKLKSIPKGRQSSNMCFLYHCTHSSVPSSSMGIRSSHTQSEGSLDQSPEEVSTIPFALAKLIQPRI